MKKTLFVLLTILALTLALALGVSANEVVETGNLSDTVRYTLYDDQRLVIEGTGEIPGEDSYRFYYVKTLEIKSGITSLGEDAFHNCQFLETVTMADTVQTIGKDAFYCCYNLKEIRLSNSLKEIGEYAFFCCKKLGQIVIPSGVSVIAENAFLATDGLSQVVFRGALPSIAMEAFFSSETTAPITAYYPNNGTWKTEDMIFLGRDVSWVPYTVDAGGNRIPGKETVYRGRFDEPKSGTFSQGGYWKIGTDGVLHLGGAETLWFDRDSRDHWNGITGLVIEPGVTHLTDNNFGHINSLVSVTIPDSLAYCPQFSGCPNLETVILGEGITELPYAAFYQCVGLQKIIVPKSVTAVNTSAFEGCKNLTFVAFLGSVSKIGEGAFFDCEKLSSVTFTGDAPASIAEDAIWKGVAEVTLYYPADNATWKNGILKNAYGSTAVWTPYTLDAKGQIVPDESKATRVVGKLAQGEINGITTTVYSDGRMMIEGTGVLTEIYIGVPVGGVTTIEIGEGITRIEYNFPVYYDNPITFLLPSTVKEIGPMAFGGNIIKSIDLSRVETIEESAFIDATLESVKFGKELKKIGEKAFFRCKNLSKVSFANTENAVIGAYAFAESDATEVTFADGVTEIGEGAFRDCPNLKTVFLGNGLKSIGDWAFYNSPKLQTVTFSQCDNATIGKSAFRQTGITDLILADGVAVIGEYAFTGNESLQSVQFGSGLQYIGRYAFEKCENLKSISFKDGDGIQFGDYAFARSGITELILPKGAHTFGEEPFNRCDALTKVVIQEGITDIPAGFLVGKKNLESVVFSDTVKTIGENAFYECPNLKSVQFGSGLETIGRLAFGDCLSLSSLMMPDSLETIGPFAFQSCTSLKTLTLNEGLKYIGDGAFYNGAFEELTIPSTVLDLGYQDGLTGAFQRTALKKITILSDKITYIPYGCFADSDIESIDIPESVMAIESWAFSGCKNLGNHIIIPSGVTRIGNAAFSACEKLGLVVLQGPFPQMGSMPFPGSNATVAYLEEHEATIDRARFEDFGLGGAVCYEKDENGNLLAQKWDEKDLEANFDSAENMSYPEGYSLGQYSVAKLNTTTLEGYGSQAFAYMLSNILFENSPASLDDTVTFEEVRVGDILRLPGNGRSAGGGRAVVVTEKHADSVTVAQGDWHETPDSPGIVHWGETLPRQQVENAEYRITRYALNLLEVPENVPSYEPEWPSITGAVTEEAVQNLIYSLKDSYPEGFPYTIDIVYTTKAEGWENSPAGTGMGCSAFTYRISDMAFGSAPMRYEENIVFEDIMVGDILHYDPGNGDGTTHVVMVLEVYRDCLVTVEANNNASVHWGEIFTAEQVEAMLGYYTRYPEGTTHGERKNYPSEILYTGKVNGFVDLHITDNVVNTGYEVYEGKTGQVTTFAYEVPEDGAVLMVFFSVGCPYSTDLIRNLEQCEWIDNPALKIIAVESGPYGNDSNADGVRTFIDATAQTAKEYIQYYYKGEQMHDDYDAAYDREDLTNTAWPFILIITEENGVPLVSKARVGGCDGDVLLRALISVSDGFARNEGHEHSYKDRGHVEATCCNDGYRKYVCSCGKIKKEDVTAAYGHSWMEASCDTPKTCSVCAATEGAALGHAWTGGSCVTAQTCSVCGVKDTAELGHIWTEATCTKQKTCSACGLTEGTTLPHDFAVVVTAPTCVTGGFTLRTCRSCGFQEQVDPVAALGHSWAPATCETLQTCKVCAATTGELADHVFEKGTCVVCGAVDESFLPGDVDGNGIVNYNDALLILRASINLAKLDERQMMIAEVDGNGIVNYNDALTVLRRSIGLA